jgi:hypothetical protein
MDTYEIKERLMDDARQNGICLPGYEKMRTGSMEELVDYYIENLDWGMEHRFPSLELLRREFSDIEDKGVYIGKSFNGETFAELQTYIFHNCSGTINVAMDYENAVMPMLYFANGCNITVNCEQKNNPPIVVPIYMTEEAHNRVNPTDSDNCRFVVYKIKPIRP